MKQIQTTVVQVTPEMAQRWLDTHNDRIAKKEYAQRPVAKFTVDRYALDMKNGNWPFNPQPIIFDTEGNIQDGQHRLWAIVRSGKTIPFQVTKNSPVQGDSGIKTLDVIDRGKPRSIGQGLALQHGLANANQMAAGAVSISCIATDKKSRVSLPTILFVLTRNGLCFHSELTLVIHQLKKLYPGSGITGAIAWYWRAHSQRALDFTEQIASLENLSKTSPALQLYRWIMSNRGSRREQLEVSKVAASAIHAHFHDEKVGVLRPSEESWKWFRKLNASESKQIAGMF